MLKEIYFAIYSIKKNIQSDAELRTSFFMNVLGMAINNIAFIVLWMFFVKSVGIIGGWTAVDIIGLQGFLALSYGIVFSCAVGLRKMPDAVASGAFDRYLLSPKNLLIRVATSSFSASAVGDVLFGAISLSIYAIIIKVSLIQIILIPILVLFSVIVFAAVAISIFSLCFYFIDSSTATGGLFELFFTPAIFHGGAFQGVMRFVFTFFIPSLLVGALPIEAIKDVSFLKIGLVAILSMVWFFLSIQIFNRAIRKYESSNFMTFGN